MTREEAFHAYNRLTGSSIALAEFDQASGLVVEMKTPSGYRELIGPFPKDTAEAFELIEHLRGEEDLEGDPNTYEIVLLFPGSPIARHGDSR